MSSAAPSMRWSGICRLGLVQAALGSVVVLVTSTLNRVMVVEYALPAMLPGVLVALHYAVQMIRPKFGHGSDVGGRRTPWIVGGMVVLGGGGLLCAFATVSMPGNLLAGVALALAGYTLVGLGVGAAGTSLLVLMAQQVDERRRAAAATIMWVMMIVGFVITSTLAAHFLDPFSAHRLVIVIAAACAAAVAIALLAVRGVENAPFKAAAIRPAASSHGSLRLALRKIWSEPLARSFTLFVFISMLAYSAQELLLEPFAGLVFKFTPGQSAGLSSQLHQGVLLGMIGVGLACSGARRFGSLRAWTVGGCLASTLAMLAMAGAGLIGPGAPLRACVFALGLANGVFAVAAIGSMMELAHDANDGLAGARMGLWGAAQAVAFAIGGLLGTTSVDVLRHVLGSPNLAFGVVFSAEAVLFLFAAGFAARTAAARRNDRASNSRVVTV